jgi:serine/threonine protein kinase
MNQAPHEHHALDLARERVAMGSDWETWYDDAEAFTRRLEVGDRMVLASSDLGRLTDESLRDRILARLDVDFERLLDTAPPALAHRLGMIAAVAGHHRYSWPLLRATAYAMPPSSRERRWAVANWRVAALEARAWSQALEAVQMLGREVPTAVPFPVKRFEPIRMLGIGGFAEVYLCRDIATDEQVVVKALARKPVSHWPHDVFHEARLLAAIDHSGVPRVRESGYVLADVNQGPYCVLDYFDGLSLYQYIEQCGTLSWQNLRRILMHVLETLDAAHRAGVLHCDVKPGNILLRCDSRGWQTQLIDFGIGVWQQDLAVGALAEERRPGTVGFAAPEQLGCPFTTEITPAVDIYSLGQTAIYAVTSLPPGQWHSEDVFAAAGPLAETLLGCAHFEVRQRPRIEQLRRFLQQLDGQQSPAQRDRHTTRLPAPRMETGTGQPRPTPAPAVEPLTGFGTVFSVADGEPHASAHGPSAPIAPSSAAHYDIAARIGESIAVPSDNLDCTVFAPPGLVLGDAALVQVFVHLPELADEAQQLAADFDPLSQRSGFKGLLSPVARGSNLLFTCLAPGLLIDDPVQQLRWQGRTESVQFGITVPRHGLPRTSIITVQVAQDGVPLGCLKFRLQVLPPAANHGTTPTSTATKMHRYRRAFASYCSRDRDEVLKRVQVLRRLGIEVFQDVLDLHPGDEWEPALLERIAQSDLFLLFWSTAAQQSTWVHRELRCALERRAMDGDLPEIVPVVLEGPPVPAPPRELAHLHFHDQILNFLETRYAS